MHEARHSKPVFWDKPRGVGWGGEREGGSGWGDICAPVADSHQCVAKPP